MNEGKPTQGTAGRANGDETGEPAPEVIPEGDFELARPEKAAGPVATEAGPSQSSGEAVESAHGALRPPAGGQTQSPPSDAPLPQPPAVTDRPKPLHDPDPYGTPPYGEPGPWAPAPPVQHPAVPPASGTAAPAPAPGLGPGATVPTPGVADVRGPAAPETPPLAPGAVGAPAFDVVQPAPGAPTFDVVQPAPGAPTFDAVPPAPGVPASGVAVPGVPAPGVAAPGVPGAGPFEAPSPVAGGGGVPGAGVPGVPVATPETPAFAPAPASDLPPSAPAALAGPSAPAAPTAPAAPGDPVPSSEAVADPWRRYDPWAAAPLGAGPLQQTGGAVLSVEQRRRRRRRGLAGGALLLALLSGGVGGGVGVYLERNGGVGAVELPQAPAEPGGRDADSVAGIAARALPSVVTLHVSGGGEAGTGTGFVLDTRGHILTNSHVVEPAGSSGEITVVFNGGQTAEAELVGRDSGYDLAVVRVTGVRGLRPLPLGNSDNVRVGDPVVAIGAPFDLEGTVTSGIISAKERPITAGGESGDASDMSYVDALQTDAPINPGNSGGPLLDALGHVVGINSAIRSAADGGGSEGGQAGSIGLGFAIPVNQGKRVAEELINTGRATHPVIGVTLDMDYAGDGARVGTDDSGGSAPVTSGGPGDRAGIRPGDVITAVDGRRVHSGEELIVKTRAHRPGDRLELTVERDGEERTLSLVLGSSDGG
ncbi:trypsin-like peptidase domain-containing protein [Streptomyces phaeoluteigriseus]